MSTKLYSILPPLPRGLCWPLLLLATATQAQDTAARARDTPLYRIDSLHAVIITGIRGAVLLRETPIAVVAVSGETLAKTIEPNIIDALVPHVPGLHAVQTRPNISKPFIRGLGYNRVLTLYDGIRQEGQQWGDEHGIEVDSYHMERAEIIKGPASLMYGSDAVAGVVSLFPFVHRAKDGRLLRKLIS